MSHKEMLLLVLAVAVASVLVRLAIGNPAVGVEVNKWAGKLF